LKNETIAIIGYGIQGPGQACNLRDNGFNVIVGQRQGKTYEKAVADGWVPGETLFSIARKRGTSVDAIMKMNHLKKNAKLKPGQILKFN
jgi:ketol-acid reductoisomerase